MQEKLQGVVRIVLFILIVVLNCSTCSVDFTLHVVSSFGNKSLDFSYVVAEGNIRRFIYFITGERKPTFEGERLELTSNSNVCRAVR